MQVRQCCRNAPHLSIATSCLVAASGSSEPEIDSPLTCPLLAASLDRPAVHAYFGPEGSRTYPFVSAGFLGELIEGGSVDATDSA